MRKRRKYGRVGGRQTVAAASSPVSSYNHTPHPRLSSTMRSQGRQGQPTVPGLQPSVDSAASARTSFEQGMRSMTGTVQQVADTPATQPSEKRRRVGSVSRATAAFTEVQSTGSSSTTTGAIKERSSRACLNCRKHKVKILATLCTAQILTSPVQMKCENADDPPCKRCRAAGRTCVFQQRANAAWGAECVRIEFSYSKLL